MRLLLNGRDHLKGNRIELSEEGKQALNQKISQLRRIYTGFINDTGKELPTIIAFEDVLEIGI